MSIWNRLFGTDSSHTNDSPEQIQQNIVNEKAVMLDVRSQAERDAGYLEGSIFIPITAIKSIPVGSKTVSQLPKDKIIYCH